MSPVAVDTESEGSLPLGRYIAKTKVEPISATYHVSLAGYELAELRRLGGDGGVQRAIERAIEDFIAHDGRTPLADSHFITSEELR